MFSFLIVRLTQGHLKKAVEESYFCDLQSRAGSLVSCAEVHQKKTGDFLEFHSQVVNIRFPTLSNILNLEVLTTETNNQTNKSTKTMIPNISLWEHSARMKLKEISACEKKTRDGSCDLGFFKTQNWFWMFFSQVQEIGVSLVLLLLFIYLYGEIGFCLVQLVLVVGHSAQVSLLNLQNITCLMLRSHSLLPETFVCFTFRPPSPKFMPPASRGKHFPRLFS